MWHVPIILVLRLLRQEDHLFEVSIDYIVKTCLERQERLYIPIFNAFST